MKKLLLTLFTALLVALGTAQVIQADDYLRIGMEAAYAPFNWTQDDDSNGAVKIEGTNQYANGYDVQIAKKIAQEMGKEPLVVKTSWNGLIPALTSGKIDMIIAGMSPTAERKKEIAFSNSYYTSEPVLLVRKDGKYASAKTLKSLPSKEFISTISLTSCLAPKKKQLWAILLRCVKPWNLGLLMAISRSGQKP